MATHDPGRRVLRFAVTGALLGGAAATGCASKATPNPAPVVEPDHVNPGPQPEPTPHVNAGPEAEPDADAAPGEVMTNPAPQPEPGEAPMPTVNPAPQPEPGG